MGSKYNFSPPGDGIRIKKTIPKEKTLAIVLIVIAVVLVVSIGGYYVTGFAIYTKNLEGEKKLCEDGLAVCNNNLNSCNSNNADLQGQLIKCQDASDKRIAELQVLLNNCTDEKTSIVAQSQAAIRGYNSIAKSSVKPICCSYSDVQSGALRVWDIINNIIVCNGNYTVNCTTGETNY